MIKNCIMYDNKICDGCGECDMCDLDNTKVCDNCGKCLDGYDYTGIQIDDLLTGETNEDIEQEDEDDNWKFNSPDDSDSKSGEGIVFIDDIDGLSKEIEHHMEHHHHDNE